MSARRYYEENAGSRTGLRIPSVTRNSRGFEDPDQFFEASKKRMAERRALGAQDEEEEDDEDEEEEEEEFDETRDRIEDDDDDDGPDRHSVDEDADSMIEHSRNATDEGEQSDDDDAVEGQISSGLRPLPAKKGRDRRTLGSASVGDSSNMDLEQSDAPSPQTAVRLAQGSARKSRGRTPNLTRQGADASDDDNDRSRTPRRHDRSPTGALSSPGVARRHDRTSNLSDARGLNFDSTIGGDDGGYDYDGADGGKERYEQDEGLPVLYDDDDQGSNGSGIQNFDGGPDRSLTFSDVGSSTPRRRKVADEDEDQDEEEVPQRHQKRRSSGGGGGGGRSSNAASAPRSSNASASRSSIGGSSLNASMGRRAFNRMRHTASMTPNKSLQSDQQQSPSRSSVSQASPAKSIASSVSSAHGRALDFNDDGGMDFGEDDNGGYNDPGYDNQDEDDDDDARADHVIIEEDVGEEALAATSAGAADHEMFSPNRENGRKSAKDKGKGKEKAKDPKGKRRARSEEEDEVENGAPNGFHVDRRIIERKNGPAGRQNRQVELIEKIEDEFHLKGMGDPDQTMEMSGPRRGKRFRYAPLEWWRGERAIFGRARLPAIREGDEDDDHEDDEDDSQVGEDDFEDRPRRGQQFLLPVPVLKEVIRRPRAPGEGTFSGMSIRKTKTGRKKGVKATKDAAAAAAKKKRKSGGSDSEEDDSEREIQFDERGFTRQPEDGWDEETDQMGLVWNADAGEETTRRIACQRNEVKTRKVFNSDFKFEKVFGVDDFMAAGVIEIPVGGSKPVKPSKTNSYTFIVMEGAVRVRIHRSNFVMAPGGMFLVPKGNTYSIENVSKRESRLFFAQARDPNLDPEQARGVTASMVGNSSMSMSQSQGVAAGPGGSQYAAAAPSAAVASGSKGRGSMGSPNKRARK
ncbi:hypothetical protein CF319_g6956 [Tilletia indica]|nr:hypothetical protein CF319_g6956 [Tilletia indica]